MTDSNKIQTIPLDQVIVDFARNRQREANEATYDDPQLRRMLEQTGQLTPALVEKVKIDGKDTYFLLQGNRRSYNLKKLQAMGKVDPSTGKVFNTLKAKVYENLSDRERVDLTVDMGSIRGFNKVELFLTTEWLFDTQYNEREVVITLGNSLINHYPPTRQFISPDKDGGIDMQKYYRGVVQTMKRAWQSPTVLRNAYVARLKNEQKWPTNDEIKELHKVFRDEQDDPANADKMYSRSDPGPKFMAEWNRRLAAWTDAANEAGNGKPKTTSMMGRQAIEELAKQCNSKTAKIILRVILRTVSPESMSKIDAELVKVEDGWKDIIDECAKSSYSAEDEPVAETAPAAAAV